jgi:hypothetical protein
MLIRTMLLLAATAACAQGQSAVFVDDFNSQQRTGLLWGNERGNWVVVNGAYGASVPSNNPLTFSSVPYDLTHTEIELNIRATDDGGIWLRTDEAGANGVLLVFARGVVYWHHVVNGNAGAAINQVSAFNVGQNLFVRATAIGDQYAAYVNGSLVTSYTNSQHPSGRVALYDFRSPAHNYDNVIVRGLCATGDCCPIAHVLPATASICPGGTSLTAVVAGSSPMAFEWQVEDVAAPGGWVTIVEGANMLLSGGQFSASGATSPELEVSAIQLPSMRVRLVASNGCGGATSEPALLTICPSDYNCDGGVDGDDVITFFGDWDAGLIGADVTGDGGVDGDDVIEFFRRWDSGC